MPEESVYEVFALRYAERHERTRRESFIFADAHDGPHPIDYYLWVARSPTRTIVVDTGFGPAEAERRGRTLLREPREALAALGLAAEAVSDVVITHMHYDHAGSLGDFPAARFHLQEAEMAYVTGPCMCFDEPGMMPPAAERKSSTSARWCRRSTRGASPSATAMPRSRPM